MVNFAESSHKFTGVKAEELHKHINKSMELSRRLEGLKSELKTSEEFIQKKQSSASGKAAPPPSYF